MVAALPQPPLIGQAAAAQALRAVLERAFTLGRGTLIAVDGAPGSGKSRLLAHAREVARGLHPDLRL